MAQMQIVPYLKEIVSAISENEVVSIIAPTGSGKSIGIPASLAAFNTRCFVTIPTVTAAVSLYNYQKYVDPTIKVGYAAEGEVHYDDETLIVYVTAGHMRRKLLTYFQQGQASNIDFCSVLMVDEVHTGNLDTSMVLYLWRAAAMQGVLVPRLVMATATPVSLELGLETKEVNVHVNHYEVKTFYHRRDYGLDSLDLLWRDTMAKISEVHHTPGDHGDFLVFVPGAIEADNMEKSLRDLNLANLIILKAYGLMNQDDVKSIYTPAPPKQRKVVICTNVAESSITISNIGVVFDTLLEKRAEAEHGGLRLVLHHISKSSAEQRKGRTGRTRPGVCYRMCTEESYIDLEEHRPPEIKRIPIYEVLMEILSVGLDPAEVLMDVPKMQVESSVVLLERLGMIQKVKGGYIATGKGHFTTLFPLNARNACTFYAWLEAELPPYPGVVALALIDCFYPSYFWSPHREEGQTETEYNLMLAKHREKYFLRFQGPSDPETFLKMWSIMLNETGGPTASEAKLRNWCSKNSINFRKALDARNIINKCLSSLKQIRNSSALIGLTTNALRKASSFEIGPFTPEGVMGKLMPILKQTYADLIFTRVNNYLYRHSEGALYTLPSRNLSGSQLAGAPERIIGLVTITLNSGGRTVNRISASLPV